MTEPQKHGILLVDDNEANIDLLVRALADDYEVSVALDGLDALDIALADPPDLILLDILMPGLTGYEVCQRLKNEPQTENIPVIFITSLSDVDDETKGLELGAVDYITKPISIPIVRARVRTHLALKNARQELEEQNNALIEAAKLREDVERITRHDLKAPLNGIIGLPQILMLDENLTEDQKETLKMIEEAGYRMLKMINLSLDLFKMERGMYLYKPAPVDLIGLIEHIFKENSIMSRMKDLDLKIQLCGKNCGKGSTFTVLGEYLLCYSMLGNLVKNSIEASPEGGRVTVRLETEPGPVIRIHNQGVVPENIRDIFFNKYTTEGKQNGTGLGTYTAKLIADIHQGIIGMETSEEKGTEVWINLPGEVDFFQGPELQC